MKKFELDFFDADGHTLLSRTVYHRSVKTVEEVALRVFRESDMVDSVQVWAKQYNGYVMVRTVGREGVKKTKVFAD